MPYSLKEKLEQIRDTPVGAEMPPFINERREGAFVNWAIPLKELASEALEEIDRLRRIAGES